MLSAIDFGDSIDRGACCGFGIDFPLDSTAAVPYGSIWSTLQLLGMVAWSYFLVLYTFHCARLLTILYRELLHRPCPLPTLYPSRPHFSS